jgi:hypothetical protein
MVIPRDPRVSDPEFASRIELLGCAAIGKSSGISRSF